MRVEIKNFRRDVRKTRQGYCELWLPDIGLGIRDVVVHRFAEAGPPRCWVSLPAKSYTGKDGQEKWWPLVWFDRTANGALQDAARAELKRIAPELFGECASP